MNDKDVSNYGTVNEISIGTQSTSFRHLYIEVFLSDKACAQLVLVNLNACSRGMITDIGFLLVRGQKRGFAPVLEYVEVYGGARVSPQAFHFSPTDVSNLFCKTYNKTMARTLELTFATNEFSQAGLDRITLTVPKIAMEALTLKVRKKDRNLLDIVSEFFLCEFRIDVGSFPVIKAANGLVVLGCDGRVKPLCDTDVILNEIQYLLKECMNHSIS